MLMFLIFIWNVPGHKYVYILCIEFQSYEKMIDSEDPNGDICIVNKKGSLPNAFCTSCCRK